ncbi:hypothetical protein ACLOJK_022685 [Asimina triloba]
MQFWHEYDVLVLAKKEDTNIRPRYIGHLHLDDGLLPDVQVWMPAGSGNYGSEGVFSRTPDRVCVRAFLRASERMDPPSSVCEEATDLSVNGYDEVTGPG